MRLRWLLAWTVVVCIGLTLWLTRPYSSPEAQVEAEALRSISERTSRTTKLAAAQATAASSVKSGRARRVEPGPEGRLILPEVAEVARTLHRPENSGAADIDTLHTLVGNYQSICGSLPFGLNHEITEQLCGENPKRYAVIPPDFASFNAAGELIDRWGTPYFFHALNDTRLEIRSAGPDKLLWSKDDVGEISSP